MKAIRGNWCFSSSAVESRPISAQWDIYRIFTPQQNVARGDICTLFSMWRKYFKLWTGYSWQKKNLDMNNLAIARAISNSEGLCGGNNLPRNDSTADLPHPCRFGLHKEIQKYLDIQFWLKYQCFDIFTNKDFESTWCYLSLPKKFVKRIEIWLWMWHEKSINSFKEKYIIYLTRKSTEYFFNSINSRNSITSIDNTYSVYLDFSFVFSCCIFRHSSTIR